MLDPSAQTEAPEVIDLVHMGRPHVIGAWRVGEVIVDPGPSSCLDRLLPVLESHPPRVIALTHIHLDHAGATGTLMRRFPEAEVWVHERGAPHLIDPGKLLGSATRLYGEHMQRLWGEVLPVAGDHVRVLRGGEALDGFTVAYTPGHASHHVCYLHESSGHAFTGDVAGVRIDGGLVLAPTPPPDIDLKLWRSSLQLVAGWQPDRLAITHFGRYEDVDAQLAAMGESLDRMEAMAGELDEDAFVVKMRAWMAQSPDAERAVVYEHAMPPTQSFQGLSRYLSKAAR